MARYKLGVTINRESRILGLENLIKIEKLDALDQFTSQFENEEQLKLYLLKKELITKEELSKIIYVMYKYNGKVKRIPVIYAHMKKYLDIQYIKNSLKSFSCDTIFLEKLANFYSNGSSKFNPQGLNVHDIRIYLSDVRRNNGNHFPSERLEVALNSLWERAVMKNFDQESGLAEINYRGLRDLALFIYKYKKAKKEQAKRSEVEYEQTTFFDSIKKEEPICAPKWILSSEGDPDFPYNSEEEKIYIKYLEGLDESANEESIENHPHYRR